jgi:hypothetical protein
MRGCDEVMNGLERAVKLLSQEVERALFVTLKVMEVFMGSRWMQAKMAKIKRDRPPFNPNTTIKRSGHTVERSNALSLELSKLVATYTGVVTKCETKGGIDTWRKRGGSTLGQMPRTQELVYGQARSAPGQRACVVQAYDHHNSIVRR